MSLYMTDKVILAFSGGLDTSIAIKWIEEKYDLSVVTVTVDVGQNDDYESLEKRAYEIGSHKGYGMMCVVDILGGILTGGGYGMNPGRPNFGHYVAAYNIEAFMDTSEFKTTMDEWINMLQSSKPAPGHDRVMYPGQPEHESNIERSENGIPLHYEVIDWFKDICGELSIPFSLV